jgi:hypothetical protein
VTFRVQLAEDSAHAPALERARRLMQNWHARLPVPGTSIDVAAPFGCRITRFAGSDRRIGLPALQISPADHFRRLAYQEVPAFFSRLKSTTAAEALIPRLCQLAARGFAGFGR